MLAPFLVMLREGFEGALVVALVFAYLRRIDRLDLGRAVWLGVAAAVAVSVGVGILVRATIGDLQGEARLRAFALVSLVAAGVLTWMIFWMRRQARHIRGDLEEKVDEALTAGNVKVALVGVAFVAVLREGVEAALFLLALSTEGSGGSLLLGAVLGLAAASALALVVYLGGRALPMRAFFTVTGIVLIVFAAGLCARAVLFLQSAGDLGSFNLNGVYDTRSLAWTTQDSEVGRFLAALFGWDPRPSIEQVAAWFLYLVPVLYLFLRRPRRRVPEAAPAASEAAPGPSLTTATQ